jgi:hypothetical protein
MENETWVLFTKRTNDPKLSWIEESLAGMGIPSRRNGDSFHAPILEIREQDEERAWEWLSSPFDGEIDPATGKEQTIDDVPDDDPVFADAGLADLSNNSNLEGFKP